MKWDVTGSPNPQNFPSLTIFILITIATIKSLFSDLTMQGLYRIREHLGRKRKIKNEHSYANI